MPMRPGRVNQASITWDEDRQRAAENWLRGHLSAINNVRVYGSCTLP